MFYELLTITPFAAVASCIALGVVTIIVCIYEVVPEASGFAVQGRPLPAALPSRQTSGGAWFGWLAEL